MPDRLKIITQTEKEAERLLKEAEIKSNSFKEQLSKEKRKLFLKNKEKLDKKIPQIKEKIIEKSSKEINAFHQKAAGKVVEIEKKAAKNNKKAVDFIFSRLVDGPWP